MSIVFCLFVSIFAFDAFETPGSAWLKIGAFIIHLLPVYLLIGLTIVAWKWETVGGALFFLPAVLFIVSLIVREMPWWVANIIAVPLIIIGGLFIWNGELNRKQKYRRK